MPKNYPADVKAAAVARVLSGKHNMSQVAREMGVSRAAVSLWVRAARAAQEGDWMSATDPYGLLHSLMTFLPPSGRWTARERQNFIDAYTALVNLLVKVVPDDTAAEAAVP